MQKKTDSANAKIVKKYYILIADKINHEIKRNKTRQDAATQLS